MTHLKQPSRSPVLMASRPITNRYKNITDKLPSVLQPIAIYLLSIPFVGLSVRILHFIWRMLAFIISALSGKILAKRQKADQTRDNALVPETHFHVGESEQERQLKEHFLVMASHELKTPMTTILR